MMIPMKAVVDDDIDVGMCVMLDGDRIAYVGPIRSADFRPGCKVLMCSEDYHKLMQIIARRGKTQPVEGDLQ